MGKRASQVGGILLMCAGVAVGIVAAATPAVLRDQLPSTKKALQLSAYLTVSSDFHSANDENHYADTRLALAPSWQVRPRQKVQFKITTIQQVGGAQKSTLANASVAWIHAPFKLTADDQLLPVAGVILPTDVEARRQFSYQGSVFFEFSLIRAIRLLGSPATLVYTPSFSKNFYEYDRNAMGGANYDFGLIQSISIDKEFFRGWSLSLSSSYGLNRSFQGAIAEEFSFSEVVTIDITSNSSLSLGHTNGGDVFAPNGQDRNIALYNPNTSTFFATLKGSY